MPQTPIRWTPADTYALETCTTRQRVIAQILDGHLNGVIRDSDWYVLDFEDEVGEGEHHDHAARHVLQ